jgi:predicted secreted protein
LQLVVILQFVVILHVVLIDIDRIPATVPRA